MGLSLYLFSCFDPDSDLVLCLPILKARSSKTQSAAPDAVICDRQLRFCGDGKFLTSVETQLSSSASMDHRTFFFATRGHSIKGKQCQHVAFKNKICICVQNNLAYFPFMNWPLVANQKARWSIVAHCV